MNFKLSLALVILSIFANTSYANSLPRGFVYLNQIDSTILQDMRYAGAHNFVGKPLTGYKHADCVLSKPAALALKRVQAELRKSSYSLLVYDCYRPQMAVNEFIRWSKDAKRQEMKKEFYPRINKANIFSLGYVAKHSGHSRGSTVDLTIVPLPLPPQDQYQAGQKLVPCYARAARRFHDGSVDMGTGFDCFDVSAHVNNSNLSPLIYYNRQILSKIMRHYGFVTFANSTEWWHYSLKHEPYPRQYFNFSI